MRKLTPRQLEQLRRLAVAVLEAAKVDRIDLGIAPEDLVVACDRALGWDAMEEESDEERQALRETSHQRCAEAWRRRSP